MLIGGHADGVADRKAALREEEPDENLATTPRWGVWGLWAVATVATIVAGWMCALAWYVRPAADDLCYVSGMQTSNPFKLAEHFYEVSNGRVVNALLVGTYAKAGLPGLIVVPFLGVVITVLVTWFLMGRVAAMRGRAVPAPARAALVLATTIVFMVAQPNAYQTYLWAAGAVSHTLPPVFGGALLLWAFRARSRGARWAAVCTVLPLGAALSLVSEETGVVLIVTIAAYLIGLLLLRWFGGERSPHGRYPVAWSVSAALGLAIGIVVMYESPGSRIRRERLHIKQSVFSPEIVKGAVHNWVEMMHTLGTTWHYLAVFAVGLLVGAVAKEIPGTRSTASRTRTWLLLVAPALTSLVASFAAVWMVRAALGAGALGTTRTWNDFLWLLILALAWYGVLIGGWTRRSAGAAAADRPRTVSSLTVAVCVLLSGFCVAGLGTPMYRLAHASIHRAHEWDRQAAEIKAEKRDGVVSPAYKRMPIGGLAEPFTAKGAKTTFESCAAIYFGVSSLTK